MLADIREDASNPHLVYIDCLRGYAILLVITSHLSYCFTELPYPVHRVAVTGWFGVQLFFIASAMTLLQSWHSELKRSNKVSISAFFIRRFFRIAPPYYIAAIFYGVMSASSLNSNYLYYAATTISFLNGLHPLWAINSNSVVPGGWSIGTEFAFYAIFPLFATIATSLSRAVIFFVFSILAGLFFNTLIGPFLFGAASETQLGNGLFFWFPNQFSIFCIGAITFFTVTRHHNAIKATFINNYRTLVVLTSVAIYAALAYVPLGHFIGDLPLIPASLAISAVFFVFIIALSVGPSSFVNRIVANIGKVSFSAYLLHFQILEILKIFTDIFHLDATGFTAIAWFFITWPIVVIAVFGVSWLSFRYIESPSIQFGKSIIHKIKDARQSLLYKS